MKRGCPAAKGEDGKELGLWMLVRDPDGALPAANHITEEVNEDVEGKGLKADNDKGEEDHDARKEKGDEAEEGGDLNPEDLNHHTLANRREEYGGLVRKR